MAAAPSEQSISPIGTWPQRPPGDLRPGRPLSRLLFTAAVRFYISGMAQGRGGQDTGAVCAVLESSPGSNGRGEGGASAQPSRQSRPKPLQYG